MRILSEEEVFVTNVMANTMRKRSRRKNRQKEVIILSYRDLTTAAFYVLFIAFLFLVAIKIATMIWSDPMLITNLEQHYRSNSEMGWNPMRTMRLEFQLEFHVMCDLLKMALTSLF